MKTLFLTHALEISGVALLIVSGGLAAYNGSLLGQCWSALQLQYPEYADVRVTDPYPTIGYRAAGKVGKYAARICLDVTLFGGGTSIYVFQVYCFIS